MVESTKFCFTIIGSFTVPTQIGMIEFRVIRAYGDTPIFSVDHRKVYLDANFLVKCCMMFNNDLALVNYFKILVNHSDFVHRLELGLGDQADQRRLIGAMRNGRSAQNNNRLTMLSDGLNIGIITEHVIEATKDALDFNDRISVN